MAKTKKKTKSGKAAASRKKTKKKSAAAAAKSPARKTKTKASKTKSSKTTGKTKAKKATRKSTTKAVKKAAPRKAVKKSAPASRKKQVVGEGDYSASRAFLKDQSDFVKRNKAKIPELARQASEALDGPEGDRIRAAEEEARSRAVD